MIFILAGIIGFQFLLIVLIFIMGQRQADKLTSKLMSRDINEYKVAEGTREKIVSKNRVMDNQFQAIDEANPEDVIRALAAETGRLGEFE